MAIFYIDDEGKSTQLDAEEDTRLKSNPTEEFVCEKTSAPVEPTETLTQTEGTIDG